MNTLITFSLVIPLIGTIVLLIWGYREPKITITDNYICISGMYSKRIPVESVNTIELIEKLPKIKYRSNGFAAFNVKKGYFKLYDKEKVILFTQTIYGPFIHIAIKEGNDLYINMKDKKNTIYIYSQLKDSIHD